MFRPALPAVVLLALAAAGRADPVTDAQKAAAAGNVKKAELKGYSVVESASLILATPLPEARAKAVAEALEKTVKAARKGLQFDAAEEAWKGKLTLYHIPDRRAYGQFIRDVAGERTESGFVVAIRGDEPLAATGVELGAKATDADVAADLGPAVGAAYFQSKVGPKVDVPAWARNGFGRAASLRADAPTGKRVTGYKAAAKGAVLGKGRGPATLGDVWGADRPDAELVATAFVDYLAFGQDKAGQDKFVRFIAALRPDENGDTADAAKAIETAGWKGPELEAAWRAWAAKGLK